jgi:hypothetical protein
MIDQFSYLLGRGDSPAWGSPSQLPNIGGLGEYGVIPGYVRVSGRTMFPFLPGKLRGFVRGCSDGVYSAIPLIPLGQTSQILLQLWLPIL